MIEIRLRTLGITILALCLLAVLSGASLLGSRILHGASQVWSLSYQQGKTNASSELTAPLLEGMPFNLDSATPAWQAAWRAPETTITKTLDNRYPDLMKRFPGGVQLTLVDQPLAPEALRGPYDPHPAALTIGAIYPESVAGEAVRPVAEAWAGCRRDQELGPARQLRCYLYLQGEPGDTLEGLAVLAWIQALDETLAGHVPPLDRSNLPFIHAHKEGEQWTYADSALALQPAVLPASSSSP